MSLTALTSFGNGSLHEARHMLEHRRASLARRPRTAEVARELLELDAALARMDAGTWGRCERCDGAVGRDRLRALPETRLCPGCARAEASQP
jgi:DnaK suppressor protein